MNQPLIIIKVRTPGGTIADVRCAEVISINGIPYEDTPATIQEMEQAFIRLDERLAAQERATEQLRRDLILGLTGAEITEPDTSASAFAGSDY